MINERDIHTIQQNGISINQIEKQINLFKKGTAFVNLVSSVTINNGILKLSEDENKSFIAKFQSEKKNYTLLKFVPASGAATRMFKHLFSYLNEQKESNLTDDFFNNLENFAFYDLIPDEIKNQDRLSILNYTLFNKGLNFSNLPKGLIPFHKSKKEIVTAFKEHLKESVVYSNSNVHFTISENHKKFFLSELSSFNEKINCSFSYQKPKTDTIAVNLDNSIFYDDDNKIVLRPSGHGALIENLNDLSSDIIFIKNIDNVLPHHQLEKIANHKMILAGKLIDVQQNCHHYLSNFSDDVFVKNNLTSIEKFASESFNIKLNDDYFNKSIKEKTEILFNALNRPIRVCGMVKNQGEPGGGPFWIKEKTEISLQIVEKAQIDLSNENQKEILENATHFNPVDLVCFVKDYQGKKFNLLDFVDNTKVFISEKTKNGKLLKALELPGLWNGAMANWNTIFVEVPLITFNPVKTVNDLLKPEHQS